MNHTIHLGVTGLRRTGKTVFLTALIYQLTQRGSYGWDAFANQRVALDPGTLQPECTFPYDQYLRQLRSDMPIWPEVTQREYECTVTCQYHAPDLGTEATRRLRRMVGRRRDFGLVQLHLHDYPGEFLLDVGMAELDFAKWSSAALRRIESQCPEQAGYYRQALVDAQARLNNAGSDERVQDVIKPLRIASGKYAKQARKDMLEFVQPSITLSKWVPDNPDGDDPGQEFLPFVPLVESFPSDSSLRRQMELAYRQFVETQVDPFVKRLRCYDDQIVLVDVLRVLRNGVECFNDTAECLAAVVGAYRYSSHRWRSGIRNVLFAATKADHATKAHRPNLSRLLDDLIRRARGKIALPTLDDERGWDCAWFTALRATEDHEGLYEGRPMQALMGVRKDAPDDAPKKWNPGVVPDEWPTGGHGEAEPWCLGNQRFAFPEFSPPRLPLRDGVEWKHLSMDKLLWNVIGHRIVG
jgi:hypothetical protein